MYRRQTSCERGRSNEQIHRPPAARLAACRTNSGVDAAERPSDRRIHWQRLERGLSPLQPVLSASALSGIDSRMRPCREFGHRDRGNCDLHGQIGRLDQVEVDDHGRVDQAAGMEPFSHAAWDPDRSRRPRLIETDRTPRVARRQTRSERLDRPSDVRCRSGTTSLDGRAGCTWRWWIVPGPGRARFAHGRCGARVG